MQSIEVFSRVPSDLLASVKTHANEFGATQTIVRKIGFAYEHLLKFTDERGVRWRWKKYGIRIEELSNEERIQNLVALLVIAARIENARCDEAGTKNKVPPTRGANRSHAAHAVSRR